MATTKRKDIEITLEAINLSGANLNAKTMHALKCLLIWPRMGIAQKTAEKQIELSKGMWAEQTPTWCKKILFKETVEDCFGLEVQVSIPLTKAKIKEISRYLLGYSLKVAGDIADDALPSPAGDFAEIPFRIANKQLLAAHSLELLAKGALDVKAADIASDENGTQLTIPLLAERKIVAKIADRAASHSNLGRSVAKVLAIENTAIGNVILSCRAL